MKPCLPLYIPSSLYHHNHNTTHLSPSVNKYQKNSLHSLVFRSSASEPRRRRSHAINQDPICHPPLCRP
ncbi:hypothetical protein RchiOBHm_Chr7g0221911 [Rosa chinensis]|uniref:Uncharacterized protein n=1 Tax=Rosa chinensis TaxID=74649 RepID=A0A2P6PD47_ROSCH|nr:hypothetical protein RchiOBHm_Chr7g0221911 [Rosa chinensis]